MVGSPRTFLRGALSFGVLGFLVGFVAIAGVSLATYVGHPDELSPELMSAACATYFIGGVADFEDR